MKCPKRVVNRPKDQCYDSCNTWSIDKELSYLLVEPVKYVPFWLGDLAPSIDFGIWLVNFCSDFFIPPYATCIFSFLSGFQVLFDVEEHVPKDIPKADCVSLQHLRTLTRW